MSYASMLWPGLAMAGLSLPAWLARGLPA